MFDLSHYRSILCLNGKLPSIKFFKKKLPIFAADGAANRLIKLGIKPQMVIGDLDSVHSETLRVIPSYYHFDQDYCDFEKSLQYLEKKNLLPSIILGMNGGCMDHVLNNINCFLKTRSIFYAPPIVGFPLQINDKIKLNLPLKTKISILGMPKACVSSEGLHWELSQYALSFPGKTSCFNRTALNAVSIEVHSGNVLILIYMNHNKIFI